MGEWCKGNALIHFLCNGKSATDFTYSPSIKNIYMILWGHISVTTNNLGSYLLQQA